MKWNKIKSQINVWSLYYREYIVGFYIAYRIGSKEIGNNEVE